MKLSAWVSASDLLKKKVSGFGEFFFKRFIKQNIFSDKDPKDVLKTLKKSGVNGIELLVSSNTKMEDIEVIKKPLNDLGLQTFSVHQSVSSIFNINIKEIEVLFKIANQLSANVVVIHLSVVGNKIFDRDYVGALKQLENKYKIKIGMENGPLNPLWLFRTFSWREDEFCSVIADAKFNITFDVVHLAQTGKDILNFFDKNKDRIVNIHLSDYKRSFLNNPLMLTKGTHLPLGEGNLPIKKSLQTLKKNRYEGIITMEINGTLSDLTKSARFIKSIL